MSLRIYPCGSPEAFVDNVDSMIVVECEDTC